jgi:hypothetical protein
MPMRPSMPKLGTAPSLIKAKPCWAALNRAGLDKAAPRRCSMRAWPGRGKAISNRTRKYYGGCPMPA